MAFRTFSRIVEVRVHDKVAVEGEFHAPRVSDDSS